MPNNIKQQIQTDLQQAKETGQLRTERIREIVKSAVSQVASEFKQGSSEIRNLVKDAVSAVIDNFQEKGGELKDEVTASIEGALEGINSKRHESIVQTQADIKRLQAQLDGEEEQLQQEVDVILAEIEETNKEKPASTKTAIDSAINAIKDSDEMALLKKRYAQLQAQLAIVRANMAARYGGRSMEVQDYLNEAKHWYNQARPQAETLAAQVGQKRSQLEDKLGEAGTSLARKEFQIKQTLRELLLTAADLFKDKEPADKERETIHK
ncbi:MAG: histidine kinase [Nostoc sp. SerVER01]|uniref:histidine kinase n=1 Tax=Nostoc sp. CCY 9925 TaxID=3103865 RepID=UPI002ADCDA47|nr:histidine kinase [Nostoc sp. SerVER01]MDZ8025174.1 histidine kinase [Nostoc sp. DedQUE11]MDZ8072157.1 histidine kinase [Nostoc sp. DedQUE01]MDZ8080781.1 histidine kinase [Nostoc sp. DcaGUA01]